MVVIQKALGRENIDEVIKLSQDYIKAESQLLCLSYLSAMPRNNANLLVGTEAKPAGVVIEERIEKVITPPTPPPAAQKTVEIVTDTRYVETRSPSPTPSRHRRHHSSHYHSNPIIVEAGPPRGEVDYSEEIVGPVALVRPSHSPHSHDRAVRAEIAILEAEREQRRLDREHYHRSYHSAHASESDLVLYERAGAVYEPLEEVTLVRREREPVEVRIEKDKKGRMSISVPKYYR